MNIHPPFVRKAFAVAKGFEARKGRGERVAKSRSDERTGLKERKRDGRIKEREREGGRVREQEIDKGYAMVFRFFTMFAPNAR